jgi:hypothetical protein
MCLFAEAFLLFLYDSVVFPQQKTCHPVRFVYNGYIESTNEIKS